METQYPIEWLHQGEKEHIHSIAIISTGDIDDSQLIHIHTVDQQWANIPKSVQKISSNLYQVIKKGIDTHLFQPSARMALLTEIKDSSNVVNSQLLHQLYHELTNELGVDILVFDWDAFFQSNNIKRQWNKFHVQEWKTHLLTNWNHYGIISNSH